MSAPTEAPNANSSGVGSLVLTINPILLGGYTLDDGLLSCDGNGVLDAGERGEERELVVEVVLKEAVLREAAGEPRADSSALQTSVSNTRTWPEVGRCKPMISRNSMAIEYASSPVAQPALQARAG